MADQWIYSRDGTDHGPVPSSTLVELAKNGELLPTDLLWKEGMAEWKPASSFPKLFPPQASADEMPVFIVKDVKPKAVAENVKKAGGKKRLWLIGGGVFLVLMILAGMAKDADKKGGQGGGRKSSGRTNSQKSDEWKQGAETGRGMVDSWKRSVRDKDHPLMSEGLLDGISKVARLYREDLERMQRHATNERASTRQISSDIADKLRMVQDMYDGFMSEAGRYAR